MLLEPETDLPWTAFLYVSGDLSPEHSSSFEQALLDDQDAREAVAVAVELLGALSIVGAEFPRTRRVIGRRRLFGISALSAAACLALAFLPTLRATRPGPADPSETALAWSNLRGEPDADWPSFGVESSPTVSAETITAAVEVEEEEVDASTDRALPSWLLSAASVPPPVAPRRED